MKRESLEVYLCQKQPKYIPAKGISEVIKAGLVWNIDCTCSFPVPHLNYFKVYENSYPVKQPIHFKIEIKGKTRVCVYIRNIIHTFTVFPF